LSGSPRIESRPWDAAVPALCAACAESSTPTRTFDALDDCSLYFLFVHQRRLSNGIMLFWRNIF